MPNSNVFLYKKSYKQFHVSSLQGRSVAKNLINKLPKNHLKLFFLTKNHATLPQFLALILPCRNRNLVALFIARFSVLSLLIC